MASITFVSATPSEKLHTKLQTHLNKNIKLTRKKTSIHLRSSLKKRSLAAKSGMTSVVAVRSDGEDVHEFELSFLNNREERLVGIFTNAKISGSKCVILCHGYLGNMSMCQFPGLAVTLATQLGLNIFRFDHPCAWKSKSERKGPFQLGNHDDEVADIAAAVAFLKTQHNQEVVALLGHSKGGTNVIKYAAEIGNVPFVINVAGRMRVREGLFQRFGEDIFERLAAAGPTGIPRVERLKGESDGFEWIMTEKDFLGRAELPMEEYCRTISVLNKTGSDTIVRHVLCLHGKDDTTIPWEESKLCADWIGKERATLMVVDGNHNFTKSRDAEQMIAAVVKFLSDHVSSFPFPSS